MDETYERLVGEFEDLARDAGYEGASDEVLYGLADGLGVAVDDVTWRRGSAALAAGRRAAEVSA